MNDQLYQQALATVQARRIAAASENERRHEEIARRIPQVGEINSQLAQTSSRIFSMMQNGKALEENLAVIRAENEEAQRIISQLLTANGYPADYLDIHYHCEKCNDTGFVGGRRCECLEKEIAAVSVRKMNRSAQLQLSSFDTFSLDYYKGRTTEQGEDCFAVMRRILSACQSYAMNFSKESPSLLFYGRTGLGKTHLSLAIAREVITRGYDVIYDSIINLLDKVEREHFGRADAGDDTLSLLLSVDLLILDDLGTEFSTQFNISVIYNIINTRLNRGLPTIISTNLELLNIRNRYEERIVSRLFAVYDTMHFIGSDIRLIKKKKGIT